MMDPAENRRTAALLQAGYISLFQSFRAVTHVSLYFENTLIILTNDGSSRKQEDCGFAAGWIHLFIQLVVKFL
jgi:hypothetical protein